MGSKLRNGLVFVRPPDGQFPIGLTNLNHHVPRWGSRRNQQQPGCVGGSLVQFNSIPAMTTLLSTDDGARPLQRRIVFRIARELPL
jgi:hypothetical protein